MKRTGDELSGRSETKRVKVDLDEEADDQVMVIENKTEEPIALSESQQAALSSINEGRNLFITGNAGSGKSFIIERFKEQLLEAETVFYVTASTGSASYNVGGMTLHSFAGIGLGDKAVAVHMREMKAKYKDRVERWQKTEVLIIDEISMIEAEYFEKIDTVAKKVRGSDKPFGGIQVLLVGDMTQLPPVQKKGDVNQSKLAPLETRYAFHTSAWRGLNLKMIKLETNFRQQTDVPFTSFLNKIRVGEMGDEERAFMKSRDITINKDLIVPENATKLFPRRYSVNDTNSTELAKIDSPSVFYDAEIYFCPALQNNAKYQKSGNDDASEKKYPVDTRLELKVGASVLLCVNFHTESGLYNGSRGVIKKFVDLSPKEPPKKTLPNRPPLSPPKKLLLFPLVEFDNGERRIIKPNTWSQYEGKKLLSSFTQIPLILSYALTIHKSQGLTLDCALVDTDVFATGQLYVALSRVREANKLFLTKTRFQKILADPNVIAFYRKHNLL